MGLLKTLFKKKKKSRTVPKPDRSIEAASTQILEAKANMRRNGFKRYQIISCRDACEVCRAMNGKNFPLSKLQIGVNAPPFHEGCKCSIAAYEDTAEYEKWIDDISNGRR